MKGNLLKYSRRDSREGGGELSFHVAATSNVLPNQNILDGARPLALTGEIRRHIGTAREMAYALKHRNNRDLHTSSGGLREDMDPIMSRLIQPDFEKALQTIQRFNAVFVRVDSELT